MHSRDHKHPSHMAEEGLVAVSSNWSGDSTQSDSAKELEIWEEEEERKHKAVALRSDVTVLSESEIKAEREVLQSDGTALSHSKHAEWERKDVLQSDGTVVCLNMEDIETVSLPDGTVTNGDTGEVGLVLADGQLLEDDTDVDAVAEVHSEMGGDVSPADWTKPEPSHSASSTTDETESQETAVGIANAADVVVSRDSVGTADLVVSRDIVVAADVVVSRDTVGDDSVQLGKIEHVDVTRTEDGNAEQADITEHAETIGTQNGDTENGGDEHNVGIRCQQDNRSQGDIQQSSITRTEKGEAEKRDDSKMNGGVCDSKVKFRNGDQNKKDAISTSLGRHVHFSTETADLGQGSDTDSDMQTSLQKHRPNNLNRPGHETPELGSPDAVCREQEHSVGGETSTSRSKDGIPAWAEQGDSGAEVERDSSGLEKDGPGAGDGVCGPFTRFVDLSEVPPSETVSGQEMGDGDHTETAMKQDFQSLLSGETRKRKRLKKLLRSAAWDVSCNVRQFAWKSLCGFLHKLQGCSIYFELEKELFGDFTDEDDIPLPTWLQPQQPQALVGQFSEHCLSGEGVRMAHKIIAVICHLSPDITFCPAMLPLIYLFLHFMEVGDTFSCVSMLLSSKDPIYLAQTKVASEASKHVLQDLTKKYAKSAYVHLMRSSTSLESVFDDWLLWIYSDLPFSHLVQLTDSYLLEGVKVLYRVGLAILILFTKYSGRRNSSLNLGMNMSSNIRTFCQTMPVTPAKLLKVAFGIRGLSRRRIWKLQSKHEAQVSAAPQPARLPRIASALSMGDTASLRVQSRTMGFQNLQSVFLTPDMMATIWSWLPLRFAINRPVLLFTSAEHGTSLMTLYSRIEEQPYTIIIIQSTSDEVFGAFCAGAWYERKTNSRNISYFGTGETFLFRLVPERCKYEWVGIVDPNVPRTANMFLAGDSSCLIIGGGNGEALTLDETMEHCRTEACDTFNNPPLSSQQDFTCRTVEVFGFQ